MKKYLFLALICLLGLGASNQTHTELMNNPLLQTFDTPFQAPPFDKILPEHYMPAFMEAMKQHKAEIEAIVKERHAPDFQNTIVPLDRSGRLLQQISLIFFNILQAEKSGVLQGIAEEVMPLMSAHSDEIAMNPKLFQRIKTVYDNRVSLGLDPVALRCLELYYNDFVRQGANLSPEAQQRMTAINSELAVLSLQYGDNIIKETNAFQMVVEKEADLAGLPQANILAAAEEAKAAGLEGKWLFTAKKPSWIPFLQYAHDATLRSQLYSGYYMRADQNNENDNKSLIQKMVNLRLERVQLLGYPNHAAYVLAENMAQNADNVYGFLHRVWEPALRVAKEELAAMQRIADTESHALPLDMADWWYYAEKLRKQKYDLDESELKPYLQLENVRDGMFYVANKLYGITFEKRQDIPLYHADVEVFEVKEANGQHLALFYLDYATRPGKAAGAWCTGFRDYENVDGKEGFPLVSVVCNFPRPLGSEPVLLSWDETETLFHEFGHALHGFFTRGNYHRIAGTIPMDMVELPSQIMENWAGEPEVLKVYAKHYQTGQPMPEALIRKVVNSRHFNQGFMTVEYVAASLLDMDWYTLNQAFDGDVNVFETTVLDKIELIPEILPRYRSTYFSHIFDGGYGAGYYVYLWAEVLDADAFNAFKASGDIYNQDLAAKFRKYILAEGGFAEPMEQYKRFRGQLPIEAPLLQKRGLIP